MSMYHEFLQAALRVGSDPDDRPPSPGELLAILLGLRARLPRPEARREQPVAESIAAHVAYDAALLRLCQQLNVDHDPAWFERPLQARARLEQALGARGIDLEALVADGMGGFEPFGAPDGQLE